MGKSISGIGFLSPLLSFLSFLFSRKEREKENTFTQFGFLTHAAWSNNGPWMLCLSKSFQEEYHRVSFLSYFNLAIAITKKYAYSYFIIPGGLNINPRFDKCSCGFFFGNKKLL